MVTECLIGHVSQAGTTGSVLLTQEVIDKDPKKPVAGETCGSTKAHEEV